MRSSFFFQRDGEFQTIERFVRLLETGAAKGASR